MLDVQDLSVRFGELTVVKELSFSVSEGEWLMIVGPNGAGKSTVLNAVTGSVEYTGRILFEGEDLRRMKSVERARRLGVLMQNHFVEYSFSVEEVVALGRYAHSSGFLAGRGEEDQRAVEEAMELCGLTEQRAQSVLTLSGGELQRTFLAQVFAQGPRLLMLDEPTNHLDLVYQKQVFSLIGEWLKTPGRAVVSVVHDLSLAKAYGSRVLLMDRGGAVAQGGTEEVLSGQYLDPVYRMDVREWMRMLLRQWD